MGRPAGCGPQRASWTALGLWLIAFLVAGSGCRTSDPRPGAGVASIVVEGRSLAEIRRAAIGVFSREHYRVDFSDDTQLSFGRKASRTSNMLYGDLLNNGQGVWERVRLRFTPEPGAWRVDCDVFRVTNHGEDFFEEETKLTGGHRQACRKLLQSIQDTLNSGNLPSPG